MGGVGSAGSSGSCWGVAESVCRGLQWSSHFGEGRAIWRAQVPSPKTLIELVWDTGNLKSEQTLLAHLMVVGSDLEKFTRRLEERGVERDIWSVSVAYRTLLKCRSKEVFRRFMNGQTGLHRL